MSTGTTSPSIQPTDEELSVFEVLLGAAKISDKPVVVRVAGGWVRDKLLGQPSLDMDVCLDTLTGEQFALLIQKYLKDVNNSGQQCSKVGVIKANPDRSKHLETATMRIDAIDLDFVNLRTEEVYDNENNRIPSSVVFGTPEQDAYRRDFTVNSLFYNVHTCSVEDWTMKGLDDLLHEKIIRTPLDPLITLKDDPLRHVYFSKCLAFPLITYRYSCTT